MEDRSADSVQRSGIGDLRLRIADFNHAMISERFEVGGLVFWGRGFDIPKR
jgi:hypothetical protein